MIDSDEFLQFLLRAKKATYASGISADNTSRPFSHDYRYQESPYIYIDTYLGGFHFIGEEAVWKNGKCIWGMNYYGKMLIENIPEGFSQFLKASLSKVPAEAPYRGPQEFTKKEFSYHCSWNGTLAAFDGREEIFLLKRPVYRLLFHGGEIQD